ncbi:carboxy terminal-processing peptidase [Parasediminibacterium sp. JCM 36343]|uniref:carboxy terminal-processing peptidase n=1 Tax=Parasediminibacterium sp. JCM 36343 TaxID=3374279 RepID=UPI00397A2138
MMLKKGWVLCTIVAFAAGFFAFRKINHNPVPATQQQKLLTAVGQLLEDEHYSPKPLDDAFSKQIFKKYLDELDGDKTLFILSDINSLKKYETTIDEEIKGTSDIQFTPAVNAIYNKRVPEVVALYKDILAKPFDFTVDETLQPDAEKQNYAATEAERKERWRKRLKYLTLERYIDLIEQREKSKVDSIKNQTDVQLEAEARAKVLKGTDRMYERIRVKLTEDERFNMFVNVITNLMDPHTDYFAPVEKRQFDEMMSGRFYGIGAQLQEQDGTIKIISLIPGGPAWKSGELMVNDIIVKVGQGGKEEMVDITGFDVSDAVKLIRGNKGTEVKLSVKKSDGTSKTIALQRDEIVQDETFARSVVVKNGDKKIGFISLPDFYADFERPDGARCSQDVAKEIMKLKDEKVDGIVMDLRFNGGGSLYEVIQMVGLFIKNGPVVQVKDREGKIVVMDDKDASVLYDGPLAVMVNETSASASEIFAAAIQDYKRGVIIGSTSTYGKGTVQRNVPLGKPLDFFSGRTELGAVKLTFQKFYRVNGGSTQLKGVQSDIVLPDPYDYVKIREKDNPSALPWDEIKKANADLFTGYADIIKQENAKIKTNTALALIKENTDWLAKNVDAPVNLKLDKYKEQQKKLRTTVNQNTSLAKLATEMQMDVLKPDYDKFYNNLDKQKGERYKAWLKALKTDLYIDEAVKIVTDLGTQQNPLVKAN